MSGDTGVGTRMQAAVQSQGEEIKFLSVQMKEVQDSIHGIQGVLMRLQASMDKLSTA